MSCGRAIEPRLVGSGKFHSTHKITLLVLDTPCHLFTYYGKGLVAFSEQSRSEIVVAWAREVDPLVDGWCEFDLDRKNMASPLMPTTLQNPLNLSFRERPKPLTREVDPPVDA